MGIEFTKEFKCCNFSEMYPVIYSPGKVFEVITEKSKYDNKENISGDMAKVAIQLGKAKEITVERTQEIIPDSIPEIPTNTQEITETEKKEIIALAKKRTSYVKIAEKYNVTKDYIRELIKG